MDTQIFKESETVISQLEKAELTNRQFGVFLNDNSSLLKTGFYTEQNLPNNVVVRRRNGTPGGTDLMTVNMQEFITETKKILCIGVSSQKVIIYLIEKGILTPINTIKVFNLCDDNILVPFNNERQFQGEIIKHIRLAFEVHFDYRKLNDLKFYRYDEEVAHKVFDLNKPNHITLPNNIEIIGQYKNLRLGKDGSILEDGKKIGSIDISRETKQGKFKFLKVLMDRQSKEGKQNTLVTEGELLSFGCPKINFADSCAKISNENLKNSSYYIQKSGTGYKIRKR